MAKYLAYPSAKAYHHAYYYANLPLPTKTPNQNDPKIEPARASDVTTKLTQFSALAEDDTNPQKKTDPSPLYIAPNVPEADYQQSNNLKKLFVFLEYHISPAHMTTPPAFSILFRSSLLFGL